MIFGQAENPIDLSNQLVAIATGASARGSVTVVADGTGYVVGEVLTIVGGTPINANLATRVEVLTVDTLGEILTARIFDNGAYPLLPTDETPTGDLAVTGGSGADATFNLTYEHNGWIELHNEVYTGGNYDDPSESLDKEVILGGEGSGTDEITIGWRTLQHPLEGIYTMELHGFFSHDPAESFKEQIGARAHGWHNDPVAALRQGTYHVMQHTVFDYALNINGYRLILTSMAGAYPNTFYLGWGNRYGTDVEYQYPMIVGGNHHLYSGKPGDTARRGGMPNPQTTATATYGPVDIVMPGATWRRLVNAMASSLQNDFVTWPYRGPTTMTHLALSDQFITTTGQILSSGLFSYGATAPTRSIHPSPADERWLCPVVVYQFIPAPVTALMEVDGMFAMSAQGGISNWDRIIVNGDYYRVFQNSTVSWNTDFFAIKE